MKTDSFTWSLETQASCMRCQRAFFFREYASCDDALARQLTHLQTMEEWTGAMIRQSLAQALSEYAASGKLPGMEQLHGIALGNMRKSWMEYLNGAWKENPESATNIFELSYGNGNEYGTLRKLPQETTDNAKRQILEAMDAFYYSPFIKSLAELDKGLWLFPGHGETFRLEETNVQEAPDFIYREKDGTASTLFWTLGNEYRPFLRLRQACHKLFAMEKCSLPSSQVNVCTVFLNDGGRCRTYIVSDADLASARRQILKGAEIAVEKAKASQGKEDYPMQPDASCNDCKYKRLCLD